MLVPIPAALMATVVISSFALYHDGTRGSPEAPFLADSLAMYHGKIVEQGRAEAEARLTGPNGQATSHGYYNNGRELATGNIPIFANMGTWESILVRLPNDDLAVITWPGTTDTTSSNGNGKGNGNGKDKTTVECTTTEVVQAVTGNGKGNGNGNGNGKTTTTTTCTETSSGSTGGTSTGGTSSSGTQSGGSSASVSAAFQGDAYDKSIQQILATLEKSTSGTHQAGLIEVSGTNNTFSVGGQTFKLNGMTIPVGSPAVLTSFPEDW